MLSLPPLHSLRAFEAAARTGSFVQAGVELGVTSAAVSQQVKALEQHLGKRLFLRRGNRLTLTDAGLAVYPRLEEALSNIADLAASVRDSRVRRALVVSVLPSLVEPFFLPRLAGFRAAEGGGVVLRVEDDPVAFAAEGIDLRITHGNLHYPDFGMLELVRDEIVPLVSPRLWQPQDDPGRTLDSLPDTAFVHTNWGATYASHPTWAAWFARAGVKRFVDPEKGVHLSWSVHSVAAAAEGVGAALAPRLLARAALEAGRVVIPSPVTLPMDRGYVAVWPNALGRRADLRALVRHLKG